MKYIVRSVIFNDYYTGVEPMKNGNFKLYWSQWKDEAKRFKSVKEAEKVLTMIHNMITEDLELSIIEVKDDEF